VIPEVGELVGQGFALGFVTLVFIVGITIPIRFFFRLLGF